MNYKRIGRTLICFLLVCVLLVNVSPIRAEASVGTLLGSIAGVTSVNVPAGLVYGAAAIALGIMAGTNDDFVNMVDYAVDTATDWVKDGTVELLRVVDETGKAAYYAAGEMLESLRSWVFTENILTIPEPMPLVKTASVSFANSKNNFTLKSSNEFSTVCLAYCYSQSGYYPYKRVVRILSYFNQSGCSVDQTYTSSGSKSSFYANNAANNCFYAEVAGGYSSSAFDTNIPENDLPTDIPYIYLGTFNSEAAAKAALKGYNPMVSEVTTSADLTLGRVSSVPIDGSSALDWSEEYASKRIYVTGGSNDPDPPDENNGKWFWPIALSLTAATLLAMSQADEWSGETPQEFDQYTQNTEFEILDRPEFDGYQAIEIAPVTNPNPNPNPDVGENPDIGGDSDTDSEAEKTWFQRIVKGIEELPSKFGSWLDKILEWLQKIWEAIITLPETIAGWIADVLQWAFAPSETFIQSKVETLIAKYPTADTFFNLGNSLGAFFGGLGAVPPIIYIDLGAAEGSYLLGGREVFLDLTWYSRYKPTVDAIIGAFIWLWLAWRVFLSIPSIIHGEAGSWGDRKTDIGASNTSGATIVHQRELPSGKK